MLWSSKELGDSRPTRNSRAKMQRWAGGPCHQWSVHVLKHEAAHWPNTELDRRDFPESELTELEIWALLAHEREYEPNVG